MQPVIYNAYGRPVKRAYSGSGYSGAGYSSSRSRIPGRVTDHYREFTGYPRRELVRKVRYFKKGVGMIRGVGKSLVDHSIGPGVYFLPAPKDPTWSPADLDAWSARAWDWLQEIAKVAEVSGKMTLWEAQRMRTFAKFYDGEIFTVHTRSAAGWPQFQLIRCHLCDNFGVNSEDGWTDGIKLDGVNRARAYRFRLRGDDRFATVPARSVVHSYLLEETDQVRGVTPLAHAINDMHDILDTLALEKESVKDLSRTSRVIYNESGEEEEPESGHFGGDEEGDELEAMQMEKLFGAEIARLRIGEKLESFRSDRPSPTFLGFIDYLGRAITTGTGFPYEFAWAANELKGPGVRYVLEKVRVAVDEWRRNEIEDTAPFITFALATAIEMGELGPAPSDWWRGEWIGGAPDVTIDKGRDASQDRDNIKAALDNFKRYYARRGLWWKTELRQKATESAYINELAEEFHISPDRIHQLAINNSGTEPTKTDSDDDDEDEEEEDKQTRKPAS